MSARKTHIALFASGAGSNARQIIRYLEGHPSIKVSWVMCNKAGAGVLEVAATYNIPATVLTKEQINDPQVLGAELDKYNIDGIVLAGFLLLIPAWLVQRYPNKIINIHPALLPKYGGKGMYGKHVHQAIIDNRETETGITIHFVNEHYDEGNIIFQAGCPITETDTPETVARKVQQLEHQHFPRVVEEVFG